MQVQLSDWSFYADKSSSDFFFYNTVWTDQHLIIQISVVDDWYNHVPLASYRVQKYMIHVEHTVQMNRVA